MEHKILAKRNGYRRAGIEFSDQTPTTVDFSKLTKDQVEAIKADTNLLVVGEEKAAAGSSKEEVTKLKATISGLEAAQKENLENYAKKSADDASTIKGLKKEVADLEKANADLKKENAELSKKSAK